MHTPRLPVVDWTDAPADLNGLVRFAERRNLVSARVPLHFNWHLLIIFPTFPSLVIYQKLLRTSFLEGRDACNEWHRPPTASCIEKSYTTNNWKHILCVWKMKCQRLFCHSFGYPIRGMFFVSYVNGERETRMSHQDNCRNMLYVMFVDFLGHNNSILTRDVARTNYFVGGNIRMRIPALLVLVRYLISWQIV